MSDAISGSIQPLSRSDYVPGVAVAVMREALNLMEIQGETVVTMIQSARDIRAAGEAAAAASAGSTSAPSQTVVADPLTARNVDLLA